MRLTWNSRGPAGDSLTGKMWPPLGRTGRAKEDFQTCFHACCFVFWIQHEGIRCLKQLGVRKGILTSNALIQTNVYVAFLIVATCLQKVSRGSVPMVFFSGRFFIGRVALPLYMFYGNPRGQGGFPRHRVSQPRLQRLKLSDHTSRQLPL